jgi:integrase
MIKKNLPKFVVRKDEVLYVRRSYKNLDGKRKQIWRQLPKNDLNLVPQILLAVNAAIKNRQSAIPKTPIPKRNSFKSVAARFEKAELIAPIYINHKKVAGKKSAHRNRHQIKILVEHFGEQDIAEITFNDCLQFKFKRLQTPVKSKYSERQRAIRTVHYELAVLRQVLNFATRERIINRSPFQDGKGLITPSDDNRRFVELSEDEQMQLVENCPPIAPYLKVIVIACLDAGFRFGELLKLKWSQVDFAKKEIRLWNWQTKTAKQRVLPMTDRLKATLLEWKAAGNDGDDAVLKVTYIRRVWHKLRASIGRDDLTLHDLRHAFATNLHKRGVNIATIQRLLGHANIQTTMIYINPSNDELHDAISVLNKKKEAV